MKIKNNQEIDTIKIKRKGKVKKSRGKKVKDTQNASDKKKPANQEANHEPSIDYTKDNPIEFDRALLNWQRMKPEHLEAKSQAVLKEAQSKIEQILKIQNPTNNFAQMEELLEALRPLGTLSGIADIFKLNFGEAKYSKFAQNWEQSLESFMQNHFYTDDLYKMVQNIKKQDKDLKPNQEFFLEKLEKDFTFGGIKLGAAQKDELNALKNQTIEDHEKFRNNVDNSSLKILVANPDKQLKGLDKSVINDAQKRYKEFKKKATNFKKPMNLYKINKRRQLEKIPHPEKLIGKIPPGSCMLEIKDRFSIEKIGKLKNNDLRREIYLKSHMVSSEGRFNNEPVIKATLINQAKQSELLGYKNTADMFLNKDKVYNNVNDVKDVLKELQSGLRTKALFEESRMVKFRDKKISENDPDFLDITKDPYFKEAQEKGQILPWNRFFIENKLRESLNIDQEKIKPYLEVNTTTKQMFKIAEKLFEIDFQEVEDSSAWDEKVKTYKVIDKRNGENKALGFLYTDLYTRKDKSTTAWMSSAGRKAKEGDASLPISVLNHNLDNPDSKGHAFMSVSDLGTLYHEFGHALHQILSYEEIKGQTGTSCLREWVEVPSQIMEYWATRPEALKNYQTGELINEEEGGRDLLEQIKKQNSFNAASIMTELICRSLYDLEVHEEDPNKVDPYKKHLEIGEKYGTQGSLDYLPEDIRHAASYIYHPTRFKHSHGSLGYKAGYSQYILAQIMCSEIFSRFNDDPYDKEAGKDLRDIIMGPGGGIHPLKLLNKYLKRDEKTLPKADSLVQEILSNAA